MRADLSRRSRAPCRRCGPRLQSLRRHGPHGRRHRCSCARRRVGRGDCGARTGLGPRFLCDGAAACVSRGLFAGRHGFQAAHVREGSGATTRGLRRVPARRESPGAQVAHDRAQQAGRRSADAGITQAFQVTTQFNANGFARIEREIAGVRTVAYVAGSGIDVVYFHGGGTWHGFEFACDWLKKFRVVLPYHPNFGESADAPAINTVYDYVSYYRAFVDALRLDSFHLVGASLGGLLAAEFAAAQPDRIKSLVLVAPGSLSTPGVAP